MDPISSKTSFSPSVLRPAIRCAGRRTLPGGGRARYPSFVDGRL